MGYIVPKTDVILLTDSQYTAAILATPASPFGTMLSRGAIRVLNQEWFGAREVASIDQEAENWAKSVSGLSVESSKPQLGRLAVTDTTKDHVLKVRGFREFTVGKGKLSKRNVGSVTVQIHEVVERPAGSFVPIIDRPLSISADVATAPPELMMRQVGGFARNSCAGCAGCAICAACVFCAEVNFFVGSIGLVGVVGLIGLASAVPGPTGSLGLR